jgi:chromosome segregation protein
LEGVLLEGFSRTEELYSRAGEEEFLPDARMVGADGTALLPPGVVFWPGKEDASFGFNLEKIEEELVELNSELAEIKAAAEQCAADRREIGEKHEQAVNRLHQREMAAALSKGEQERRRQALRKLELSRETVSSEIVALEEEERKSSGRLQQLELELKDCPSPDQVEETRINTLRDSLAVWTAELRSLETEVTELKIAQASCREREENVAQRLERLKVETRERENLLSSRALRTEEDQSREEVLRAETVQLKEEILGVEKLVEESQIALAALEEEIELLNRQCDEKELAIRKIRPRFQEVQEKLGSQDVSLAELRIKEQEVSRRIREKYHLEIEEIEVPVEVADREALLMEVEGLQEKMEKMTNVNLAALEEKENYQQRFTLLSEQQADLVAATRDIEEAITKINITAREKLQTTYDLVRRHFQDLFCRLFGGGQADLILDDEKDILESGLDIIAQPPGKKLSHISLLSGGERALTTIALIFALFQVQPSPFYILDEIDAPLDEANIGRFSALLKELVSEAQFIIITHNKRSISEADILYGITMEESGVSKVVSVRLGSHGEEKAGEEDAESSVD